MSVGSLLLRGAPWVAGVVLFLLLAGWAWERWAEAREAKRFPPPGRMVEVGEGRRAHLLCEGSGGPTVVIEQGAGEPSILWRPVQAKIARFARVCLYDRAGYLWSDPAHGPRSMQQRVDDLDAILSRAGEAGPYVLVAHSYGGLLVRLYARQHPSKVAALVLVDTPDEGVAFAPDYLKFTRQAQPFLGLMTFAARVGALRAWSSFSREEPTPGLTPAENGAASAAGKRASTWAAVADDLASINSAPQWMRPAGALGSMGDKPVMVLTHGKPFPGPFAFIEKLWPAGQARQVALSTNSAQVIASNSNHMISHDEPQVVVEGVRRAVEAVRTGGRL